MSQSMQTRSHGPITRFLSIAKNFTQEQTPSADEPVAGSGSTKNKRKREAGHEDGAQKRRRLDNTPKDDGNKDKPEPSGMPPVWAEKRAAIADALPYFRAHQSGLHSNKKVAKGFLIGAKVEIRDRFESEVIITSPGGGHVEDKSTRQMVREKDQEDNFRIQAFSAIMKKPRRSLVVIADSGNPLFPVKPPHEYNVLDHFQVTDIWSEKVHGHGGKLVKIYRIRLEKVNLKSRSWWTPKDANEESIGEVEVGHHVCALAYCLACRNPSKVIYKQGWTCLHKDCKQFFCFPRNKDSTDLNPAELEYNEDFLKERTPFLGDNLCPLVPPLPQITDKTFGSEKEFKAGIVCPRCGCCIRRMKWVGWFCENPLCEFSYRIPLKKFHTIDFTDGNGSKSNKDSFDKCVKRMPQVTTSNHIFTTYFLPDEKKGFLGTITVIRPREGVFTRSGGINDLYTRFQDQDLGLERRGARAAGSRIEELTSHFSANYGAPYKFGVVVKTTMGLPGAQPPIVETLLRLTWAGEASVAASTKFIKDENLKVDDDAIPDEFEKFNELLALGYFEGSKISAHDDGEKELGPTVATLSLGSASLMKFSAKKGVNVGAKGKFVLSLVLKHGDMLVMHGAGIQKFYLHEVSNLGKHRFAMTCRHIRPESIADKAQRERAKIDGQLSKEWASINYNGHSDRFESKTGDAVECPTTTTDSTTAQVQQSIPTDDQTKSGDIETRASSSTPEP
ncbi:uncharacterized protein GGS22DRAFT_189634 [Annulohypoxylon maeteangense]|uniref:uncharacterized protein n=1 Tax=Annulohypoxylon maeteangense TaxID=1927788 RepID=UPI0020082EE8|nr:uncharacterized protein GGS22DRAFT_189634 [Annulohypoxylon maeteangense]KAI0883663.1 hypothetical protein GGS22DRAFT_189634 [Annulohypoxylon maeteangense]